MDRQQHSEHERDSSSDADALQQDIHETRERLDQTIGALEHQLAPGELIDQILGWFRSSGASGKVGSKAGDLLSSLGHTIKDNPIPTALIGIGLIGLATDGRSKQDKSGTRESLERGYQQVRQRLEDDPLVLGALGIALGAALGAGLPRTRIEDQTFGEARDELASKAKRAVEQVRHEVAEQPMPESS
ncbi:MAG TPA: DUF3618 domain-containing protein [Enhygromyxa sp.]|nr:DUF3618 domain-containing protein [Enhygromyxa sp.]